MKVQVFKPKTIPVFAIYYQQTVEVFSIALEVLF